jgi:hypothetical protein
VLAELDPWDGPCAGGPDGIGKLLGPKMSLRVAGTGEIKPVDGVAEKSEFCAKVCVGLCALAPSGTTAKAAIKTAGPRRANRAAIAGAPFMRACFRPKSRRFQAAFAWCLWPD